MNVKSTKLSRKILVAVIVSELLLKSVNSELKFIKLKANPEQKMAERHVAIPVAFCYVQGQCVLVVVLK